MRKILFISLLTLCIPLISHAETKKSAVYFYSENCSHCQRVNAYFIQQGFYEKYDIKKLNVAEKENQEILGKVFEVKKSTKNTGIPAMLIDENLLLGDQPIIDSFQETIEQSQGTAQEFIDSLKNKEQTKTDFSFLFLLGAAFVDAINPCEFAVLIILLATVLAANGKKRALFSGLMFSLAIFLSYFLMGLGVYKAITAFGISRYFSLGIGVLAIIIALANFKDVIWYGKGFIMEVPVSWRPKMKEIIKKVTSPWSAFGIGIIVSLFLVPCTSGPYVVILGMLADKGNAIQALPLLVLYNIIFVTPMILISLGMYFFNARMGKLEGWRQENLRVFHAIAGIIMLLLGIYMISTRI